MRKPSVDAVKAWFNILPMVFALVWVMADLVGWRTLGVVTLLGIVFAAALQGYWRLTDWLFDWAKKRWDLE